MVDMWLSFLGWWLSEGKSWGKTGFSTKSPEAKAGKMALKPHVLPFQGSLAPLCPQPRPPWRESSQAQVL